MNWRFLPRLASFVAGVILSVAAGAVAHAETLRVSSVFPAQSDGAAALDRIALETFGGVDGAAVSIALGDRLRNVMIQAKPYFHIVPAGMGNQADGLLRGTVEAQVQRQAYTEKRDKCVESDGNGKCLKRGKIDEHCIRRTVTLNASVRLVARNGNLLYASEEPVSQTDAHCLDYQNQPRPIAEIVSALAGRLADNVRAGIAPVERSEDIRVKENRKALPRELQGRFKDAVHLTKRDPAAACTEWQAIDQASPGDPSTVFNLGLCAESQDHPGEAERRYQQALQISPRDEYATMGLHRIEERMRADHQLAAHYGA